MRVLTLVPGLDPARGGMASAAANMVLAARRVGIDCVVAVPEHGGKSQASSALIEQLERAGVMVHALPVARWPRQLAYRWGISPAQAIWTARHIGDFDLVHVHGVWGIGPLSGLTAGRAASKPVIVTAHESLTAFDIDNSRTALRRRQKLALKSLYLSLATLFVLTSELEARDSLPTSVAQRTVHYPVVDSDVQPPAIRARGRAADLHVGFLARIDPKKNLELLIDAMPQLPSHVHLVVAGDGPAEYVTRLKRRVADAGLNARVEWLGFVQPAARARFLDHIDVLALPSIYESFGLSAAEAMHAGVPVLVSERTGISELIRRRGGGEIAQASVASVAAAIRALDADRQALGPMGADAQAAVREELSYTRIGMLLRDSYNYALELHR